MSLCIRLSVLRYKDIKTFVKADDALHLNTTRPGKKKRGSGNLSRMKDKVIKIISSKNNLPSVRVDMKLGKICVNSLCFRKA